MEFQRKKSFQEKIKKSLRRNFSIEVFKIENFFNVNSKKKFFQRILKKKNFSIKIFQKRSTKEILEKIICLKENFKRKNSYKEEINHNNCKIENSLKKKSPKKNSSK